MWVTRNRITHISSFHQWGDENNNLLFAAEQQHTPPDTDETTLTRHYTPFTPFISNVIRVNKSYSSGPNLWD